MFFGEYEHQIDQKNRIRIPAKLKNDLGDKYFFMKGTNKCISVRPASELDKFLSQFNNISPLDEIAQESLSMVIGSIKPADEDPQGRVILPDNLKQYAGITKDVVAIGMIDHIDIYSKEERERIEKERPYSQHLAILKEKVEHNGI